MSTLQNDHPDKSSYHLSPYNGIIKYIFCAVHFIPVTHLFYN